MDTPSCVTEKQLRSSGSGCLTALGILNIIFGLIAMGAPLMTGNAVTIVIGAALLASGILELIHSFSTRGQKAGIVSFLSGAFAIVGGGLILTRPLFGLVALTLMLASYFVVEGILRCLWAFKMRSTAGWPTGNAISSRSRAMPGSARADHRYSSRPRRERNRLP